MTDRDPKGYQAFLDFFREQSVVENMYIRISPAPKGYIGWAARKSTLKTFIDRAGIEGEVDYNDIPAFVLGFPPATGSTAIEAARNAVEAYVKEAEDPDKKMAMNAGYVAVVESLRAANST